MWLVGDLISITQKYNSCLLAAPKNASMQKLEHSGFVLCKLIFVSPLAYYTHTLYTYSYIVIILYMMEFFYVLYIIANYTTTV